MRLFMSGLQKGASSSSQSMALNNPMISGHWIGKHVKGKAGTTLCLQMTRDYDVTYKIL